VDAPAFAPAPPLAVVLGVDMALPVIDESAFILAFLCFMLMLLSAMALPDMAPFAAVPFEFIAPPCCIEFPAAVEPFCADDPPDVWAEAGTANAIIAAAAATVMEYFMVFLSRGWLP
jgi:hypothetical protein